MLYIRYVTYDGVTTDFNTFNTSVLNNLSGAILENSTYGKVEFNENINLTLVAGANRIVDFDIDLNISDNLINLDSNDLPWLNKSVNLSFYGITYITPVIYHNAALCADCTLISYSGGVYKSEIDLFSGVYYLIETYVPPAVCGNGVIETGEQCDDGNTVSGDGCSSTCQTESDPGPGPGPGPGPEPEPNVTTTGTEQYDFIIDPDFIQLEMNKGTYYKQIINVTNNGTDSLTITVSLEGVGSFIFPQDRSFTLLSGESKNLRFDIYVSSSRLADVYVGKIHFKTIHVRKEAEVVLQVKESDALFDIRTEVLKKYIPPGGRVRANVSIINMGDLRNFDVSLEYKAMDFESNEYTIKKEDFAMGKSYSRVFYLDLPNNLSMGNYLFYTQVSYKDVNASSYDTFVVEKISTFSWILLIIIIIIAAYLIYKYYTDRKKGVKFTFKKSPFGGAKKEESRPVKKEKPVEVPKLPDSLE